MKNTLLLFCMIWICSASYAQVPSKKIPISIGYYGHILIQPGLKIGTHFNLKEWETEKAGNNKTDIQTKSIFVSPQIGFFTRPGNNNNFLFNADIGYKRMRVKRGRQSYIAYSIGLGYWARSQIIDTKVNLNDGSVGGKSRMYQGFLLSTANFEFGRKINSNLAWYSKYSLGTRWSPSRSLEAVIFVELGINFSLN